MIKHADIFLIGTLVGVLFWGEREGGGGIEGILGGVRWKRLHQEMGCGKEMGLP